MNSRKATTADRHLHLDADVDVEIVDESALTLAALAYVDAHPWQPSPLNLEPSAIGRYTMRPCSMASTPNCSVSRTGYGRPGKKQPATANVAIFPDAPTRAHVRRC